MFIAFASCVLCFRDMAFTRRWKGRPKKEVSESMSALATRKAKRMTKLERSEHGKLMAKGRGEWISDAQGKRVFIRTKKASV